jgi:TolA-binding protein
MAEEPTTTATETEVVPTVSTEFPQESSVIRNLRQQVKEANNKIQELSQSKQEVEQKAKEVPTELAQRLERLEFDQFINAKPNLADKKADIWTVKSSNPNLSVEDATALVLGKAILSATPTPTTPPVYSSNVNIQPNISDLASKSDEELANLAKQELENSIG